MSNKGIKKILAVALLSTIGLAACSKDIQAKPKNYDDKLIAFSDSKDEIYHNLVSIIDDAYREGTLASVVLDKVLYQYSVSVFGRYNRVAKPDNLGSDEITLKEAARQCAPGYTGEKTIASKFIENHKAFWSTDNDGNRLTTDEAKQSEFDRVYAKWKTIEDRIAKDLYGDISGGSYNNTRGYFREDKFLASLKNQLHKVKDPYAAGTTMTTEDEKVLITPDVEEEEVFDYYLHRENYQDPSSWDLAQTEDPSAVTVKYVEEEVIPSIYRTLLVEQYLLDESYNNLGRSAARKINVLAISTNDNNDKGADYLMKYFVREKISKKGQEITLDDFKAVSNAVKGLVDSTGHNAYLDEVNSVAAYEGAYPRVEFKAYDGNDYSYYLGTDFGDMMAKYAKIKSDINLTDTSVESDFTGEYTYSAEVGKEIKENNIKKKDYTVDGWYIKSNGVSDLPDDIKSRLFNIGVANVLDDETVVDRWAGESYNGNVTGESKLVAKINGKHYLKVASKQSGADPRDDILFYEGGKYYIIQIEEAVSGSKLAKETTTQKYDSAKKEDIINEVAKVIANNDTYVSSSTKHWLEEAALKYHDTKVYDYFKSNYPDLFDD